MRVRAGGALPCQESEHAEAGTADGNQTRGSAALVTDSGTEHVSETQVLKGLLDAQEPSMDNDVDMKASQERQEDIWKELSLFKQESHQKQESLRIEMAQLVQLLAPLVRDIMNDLIQQQRLLRAELKAEMAVLTATLQDMDRKCSALQHLQHQQQLAREKMDAKLDQELWTGGEGEEIGDMTKRRIGVVTDLVKSEEEEEELPNASRMQSKIGIAAMVLQAKEVVNMDACAAVLEEPTITSQLVEFSKAQRVTLDDVSRLQVTVRNVERLASESLTEMRSCCDDFQRQLDENLSQLSDDVDRRLEGLQGPNSTQVTMATQMTSAMTITSAQEQALKDMEDRLTKAYQQVSDKQIHVEHELTSLRVSEKLREEDLKKQLCRVQGMLEKQLEEGTTSLRQEMDDRADKASQQVEHARQGLEQHVQRELTSLHTSEKLREEDLKKQLCGVQGMLEKQLEEGTTSLRQKMDDRADKASQQVVYARQALEQHVQRELTSLRTSDKQREEDLKKQLCGVQGMLEKQLEESTTSLRQEMDDITRRGASTVRSLSFLQQAVRDTKDHVDCKAGKLQEELKDVRRNTTQMRSRLELLEQPAICRSAEVKVTLEQPSPTVVLLPNNGTEAALVDEAATLHQRHAELETTAAADEPGSDAEALGAHSSETESHHRHFGKETALAGSEVEAPCTRSSQEDDDHRQCGKQTGDSDEIGSACSPSFDEDQELEETVGGASADVSTGPSVSANSDSHAEEGEEAGHVHKVGPESCTTWRSPQPAEGQEESAIRPLFTCPAHPADLQSRAITMDLEQQIVNMRGNLHSLDAKRKFLKKLQVPAHPDKGGTDEAMYWLTAWRRVHEEWFMQFN